LNCYFHAVVVQLGFHLDAYNATEDSGAAVVCVTLTGSIARNVSATLFTSDMDAVGRSHKVMYQFLGITEGNQAVYSYDAGMVC